MTDKSERERNRDRLYAIVQGFRAQYVEFDRLKDIAEDLRMLVNRDNTAAEGGVMTLLGESGSGKTHFINSFVANYPREPLAIHYPDGKIADRATVVVVDMPDSGVNSVIRATYAALAGVQPPADKRHDVEMAICHFAEEQQTKLIIYEESHEAARDPEKEAFRAVGRLLKRLANKATFSVLLVGTEDVRPLVLKNRELHRRNLGFHTIKPFDWNDDKDRSVFVRLMRTWDNELQKGFKRSGLGEIAMAAKIFRSSDGIIGWAAQLIERAGSLAARDLDAGTGDHITEAHLKAAHDILQFTARNPFSVPEVTGLATAEGEVTLATGAIGQDLAEPANGEAVVAPTPVKAAKRGGRKAAPDRRFRP